MESNRIKNFQGMDIVFYLKTKNYNYYRCSLYGCKGEYREDIHANKIQLHKRHSSKCYSLKKLESVRSYKRGLTLNSVYDLYSIIKRRSSNFYKNEKNDNVKRNIKNFLESDPKSCNDKSIKM